MTKELTAKQVSEILGVSRDMVERWVKSGKVKARRAGIFPGKTSPILIPASEVERLKKLSNVAQKR